MFEQTECLEVPPSKNEDGAHYGKDKVKIFSAS
jgi:hypothetical protein